MNVYWILLLLTDLLLPIVLMVSGLIFLKYTPPYSKDALFGYRTRRSKLNQDTWEFAHKHFGKITCVLGSIMLPLSVIPLLFVVNGNSETIAFVGTAVIMIQTIVFLCAIFPTERALKNTFDEWGYRR